MSAQKKSIKIENLLLNLENPRFDHVKDQKEALDVMLMSMTEKIKKLAQDIVENGIDPGKLLRVSSAKQQNKYIVLDGNRRLTAIKLIKEPSMIKEDNNTQQFFQNLKQKMAQNVPETLSCLVFSSREEANHWIELEHTGENKGAGQVSWNAEQKARFKSQVSSSRGRPYIKVIDFMQKNKIYLEPGRATNIERLVSTSYVKKKIGLDFQNGNLIFTKDRATVLENLKKIASAMKESGFNVREIDKKEQRTEWTNKVLNNKKHDSSYKKQQIKKKKSLETISKRNKLIPKNFNISIRNTKVQSIYEELRKLNVEKYSNAIAVLFRVFLELSVKYFIDREKEQGNDLLQDLKTTQEDKQKIPLSTKINCICKYMEKEQILAKNTLQPVRIAIQKQYDICSTHTFNSYVHNLDHIPLGNDLKKSWDNMEKFIEKLWE